MRKNMAQPEDVVRTYLIALKDPAALRDDESITTLEQRISDSDDEIERLKLRQQLLEANSPTLERFEDDFVTHAKAWAEENGVTAEAFASEGVPSGVLRRAGFSVAGGRGRKKAKSGGETRTRVTSDEVRAAIPDGTFTIKMLQERSGASPAVVRKVVSEGLADESLTEEGTDPDHSGPGRAPTLYKKRT
jgi:hypothetical protein